MAVEDDESRATGGLSEYVERLLDALEIVGIAYAQNVPPVRHEACGHVLCKGQPRVTFDGAVIVVVDPAEVIESQMRGQRGSFRPDAFHQAAITAHRIDVVVEDLEPWTVVAGSEPLLRDGHADARRDSLAERTGGRLDAGNPAI